MSKCLTVAEFISACEKQDFADEKEIHLDIARINKQIETMGEKLARLKEQYVTIFSKWKDCDLKEKRIEKDIDMIKKHDGKSSLNLGLQLARKKNKLSDVRKRKQWEIKRKQNKHKEMQAVEEHMNLLIKEKTELENELEKMSANEDTELSMEWKLIDNS